jgi:hypothetical protein
MTASQLDLGRMLFPPLEQNDRPLPGCGTQSKPTTFNPC